MNNYSFFQRQLHRLILSSQFFREITYGIERTVYSPKIKKNSEEHHVFITGLARSGTTILLHAIHGTGIFASLTYDDMPFILAPNLWSSLSINKNHKKHEERAHQDGIQVSTNSPESFEEIFWKTIGDTGEDVNTSFKEFVNLVLLRYSKERYLSKNNQNILRIQQIFSVYPSATLLIPFRNPLQHANSLLQQHTKFIKMSNGDEFVADYMKYTGHSEFGRGYVPIMSANLQYTDHYSLNHWLEQWLLTYTNVLKQCSDLPHAYPVCYERLCSSPILWEGIKKKCGIPKHLSCNFSFKESKKEVEGPYSADLYDSCLKLYENLDKKCI